MNYYRPLAFEVKSQNSIIESIAFMKSKQHKPNSQIVAAFFALAALALAGCSDPAEGVKEAEVAAPAGESAETEAVAGAKTYTIRTDSEIGFTGSKITASHSGGFKTFAGTISVANGNIAPPSSIEIDMNSTWSDSERLTRHLKSADFFDVPTYPSSKFVLTAAERSGGEYTITGDLTLHGVTKSIRFPAKISIADEQVSLEAEFSIMRFDFDIVYEGRADDLIRDRVVIRLDVKADADA